ncbi:hypothetical protein KKD19_00235 [Patescibacteria group bacterium]|nr:hypothetical protein [Patescibacteria group bacterium]MCG2692746.1 hypothetical protein [Candidatus Parcubacteria bacterium]
MFYPGRMVSLGLWEGRPFVGFTLASRSLPFRKLQIREQEGRIYVMPRKGHLRDNVEYPEVDNYGCVVSLEDKTHGNVLVACNGHMTKRIVDDR